MTSSKVKDLPASVRARLLNLARERGEDFTGLLTRYALERFMFRLGSSDDPAKGSQWRAFLRRGRLVAGEPGLDEVVELVGGFLLPMLGLGEPDAASDGQWPPGGPG
jgi:hypothetical protein